MSSPSRAASVYVPHPLQNKTTKELHTAADKALEQILRAICTSSENLTLKSVA